MNHHKIRISLNGAGVEECAPPVRLSDVLADAVAASELPPIGALVNNEVVSLNHSLEVEADIHLLTLRHPQGWHIYRRSLCFVLAMAVREVFPEARFAVEHSLGSGFYCRFERDHEEGVTLDALTRLEDAMRETIAADRPIESKKLSYAAAVDYFKQTGTNDKYNLLRFQNPPMIDVHLCGDFIDLAHGVRATRTGALQWFKLIPYESGFVLQFPERDQAPEMSVFEPQPHLFNIFKEHKQWGRILNVRTVGDLNVITAHGDIPDFIRTAEALHEKKIARIADRLAASDDPVRYIFIAGPSSSGKTTLAKRLAVHLKVNGIRALDISLDDYFIDRDKSPLGDDGKPDFEHLNAIDIDFFQEQLLAIDSGAVVPRPRYSFEQGSRVYRGEELALAEHEVVIIEGIHGLNPRLIEQLPHEKVKRIYVSALTQLNLDFNNRISTTDNRLLRRIVRDHKYRGHDALTTLRMWPSVRKGEKRWIFPYQQEADFAFNSALDYEIAVLRLMVEPLLAEVKPWHEEYAQARRLLDFVRSFLSVPPQWIPPTSILREFIGQSNFRY